MASNIDPQLNETPLGLPAWRVALFYPAQGSWSEADYLNLSGGPLVEFDDGYIDVLDMPTKQHQRIVQYLFLLLHAFVTQRNLGEVFMAPLPVRLWKQKFREPDVLFVEHGRGETKGYPDGADLVIEVVSPGADNRRRDLEIKPIEYQRSQIPEYWVIDAEKETVTLHLLIQGQYQTTTYDASQTIASQRLPGLTVPVAAILNAANPRR